MAYKMWTPAEKEILLNGVLAGKRPEEIGVETGRGKEAIRTAKRRYYPRVAWCYPSFAEVDETYRTPSVDPVSGIHKPNPWADNFSLPLGAR